MPTRLVIKGVITAVVVFIVAIFAVITNLTAQQESASACPAGQVQPVNITGVTSLDTRSLRNAGLVIAEGQRLNIPPRGQVIAIASALQESTIHNLANSTVAESLLIPNDGIGHDHDSVGIEQQRASWGTVTQRMDVPTAARFFFEHLLKIKSWQTLPVTEAAQQVQGSAFPNAYAKWEPLATQLVTGAGITTASGCIPAPPQTQVTGAAGIAIADALSKVGTLYQFGGSCTDPHSTNMSGHCDCSSLVMTAWKAAGKPLPRTSEDQYLAVQHITGAEPTHPATLLPGDLLFYSPGIDGRPGLPGHVAMYIGGGKLVEAPQPGQTVHVIPIYTRNWLGAGRVT